MPVTKYKTNNCGRSGLIQMFYLILAESLTISLFEEAFDAAKCKVCKIKYEKFVSL